MRSLIGKRVLTVRTVVAGFVENGLRYSKVFDSGATGVIASETKFCEGALVNISIIESGKEWTAAGCPVNTYRVIKSHCPLGEGE